MKDNDFSSPEEADDFSSFNPAEDDDEQYVLDSDDNDVSAERRYWQERFEEDDGDPRHRERRVKKKGKYRDKESD